MQGSEQDFRRFFRGPVRVSVIASGLLLVVACSTPQIGRDWPFQDTSEAHERAPTTMRQEVVGDDYHGTWVRDPYRWLEDQDGERTREWTAAQNRLTESFLARVVTRGALRDRLKELWNFAWMGAPRRAGEYWYHTYNDGLKNQSVLLRSKSPAGDDAEVVLDPNTLSNEGTTAIGSMSYSKDGRHLAYSFSKSGSDWQEFKVVDLSTGATLDDHLRWTKFTSATWLPDHKSFLYSRYPAPEEGRAYEAKNRTASYCLHRLGTDQQKDVVVFRDEANPGHRASAQVSDDGQFLVFTISVGTDARNLVSVLDVADLGKRQPTPLFGDLKASYRYVGSTGRVCYFLTDDGAERRRLIAVDVSNPVNAEPKTVVAESEDTLESVRLVGDRFVLTYMKDVHNVVRTCGLEGGAPKTVALPGLGSVSGFTGGRKDTMSFFSFQSFTQPSSVYRLDPKTGATALLHRPELAYDPEQFETRQVAFQSKDGTRVPMFVVHKKDLALTGDHPTYLYGYGGFNISLKPRFSPQNIAWLELGGVFAQPTLRGGGEFGRAWHEAGMLDRKQNVFDDFIAAAEFLLRNDYTRRDRLAIGGRSNGGLLVGATMTQRPDLFGAAIPEVGVLDMLRYHEFTIGAAWIPEYGSSADPDMFPQLLRYSPLHNIEPGTAYPPTLVMTGDHDDRVLPGHSYKFAATLQRAYDGPNPILIRVDSNAGHGAGKPTHKRIDEAADRWAFLLATLGGN